MLKIRLEEDLKKVVSDLGFESTDIVFREQSSRKSGSSDPLLSIPKKSEFGDYTTNIPLQLANQKSKNDKHSPLDIAKEISKKMGELDYMEKVEIAGPGFLNFFLNPKSLMDSLGKVCNYSYLVNPKIDVEGGDRKKILVEYGHPNTHKEFHIGHMRDIITGESVVRLLESEGNKVFRVNYQGDIGLHVAKAIWGLQTILDFESKVKNLKTREQKAHFLGQAYASGSWFYRL
jgi:arginyl-tRNA synthetase